MATLTLAFPAAAINLQYWILHQFMKMFTFEDVCCCNGAWGFLYHFPKSNPQFLTRAIIRLLLLVIESLLFSTRSLFLILWNHSKVSWWMVTQSHRKPPNYKCIGCNWNALIYLFFSHNGSKMLKAATVDIGLQLTFTVCLT